MHSACVCMCQVCVYVCVVPSVRVCVCAIMSPAHAGKQHIVMKGMLQGTHEPHTAATCMHKDISDASTKGMPHTTPA